MSVRSIWVISLAAPASKNVVFDRKYSCVERQAQKLYGTDYRPLPDNSTIFQSLSCELRLSQTNLMFLKHRDTCEKHVQVPVINLKVPNGFLWPFIVIEQSGYLFCCLPLVIDIQKLSSRTISEVPSVSIGFSLLRGISEFFATSLLDQSVELQQKILDLSNVLTICMPFGSPIATDLFPLQSLLQVKNLAVSKSNVKQAAWRPTPFKGKSSITIQISEFVRLLQHGNRADVQSNANIYGSLFCRAELDGGIAHNVSMSLVQQNLDSKLDFKDVVYHPCIQSSESGLAENGTSYRLKFSPPLHQVKLLDFTIPLENGPPIHGSYKLQGNETANVLLQLTLNEKVKNSFEYCEARLPFFNRGRIHHADCQPTTGSVTVSNDRRTLIWNIGQKFPNRSSAVVLTAVIHFTDPASTSPNDDLFCTGMNAYAQVIRLQVLLSIACIINLPDGITLRVDMLNFKVNDYSYNGCQVDQKYVQTSPASKFKFFCSSSLTSSDYKFWNEYGESPFAVN